MSPYQRIMRAAKRGTGMHLAFKEVQALSEDTAISARADFEDEEEEMDKLEGLAIVGAHTRSAE